MARTARPYDEQYWSVYDQQELGKDEPPQWYERYLIYRNLGRLRDLFDAQKIEFARQKVETLKGQKKYKQAGLTYIKKTKLPVEPKGISQIWKDVSKKYNWDRRAGQWDNFLQQKEDLELAEKRVALRRDELNLAGRIREKVEQMLAMPLSRKIDEYVDAEGRHVMIIEPTKWSLSDAAKLIELYSKLSRLSLEMNTSTTKSEIDVNIRERSHQLVEVIGNDPEATNAAYTILRQLHAGKGDASGPSSS